MQSFLEAGNYQHQIPSLRQTLLSKSRQLKDDTRKIVLDIDAISSLLTKIDPPPSNLVRSLDLKAGDLATYYFAGYSAGLDFDASMSVYRIVKNLVRYILFADRYYETGNLTAYSKSRIVLANAKKEAGGFVKYAIHWSIRQFTPFWQFEQSLRRRMIRGEVFSSAEIAHHNLFKSSDARHIYAAVLENALPEYDQNVTSIIHYNQALQDIYDDFVDIGEDLADKMPNVFIMASSKFIPFSELSKMQQDDAESRILLSNASDVVLRLAERYKNSIDEISLPREFQFLKALSSHYFDSISLAVQSKSIRLAHEA